MLEILTQSKIHLVGGEKGGVGKSMVARLLAQHFIDHPDQIAPMGQASRQLAAEVFDVRIVNHIILRAMALEPAHSAQPFVHQPCPQGAGA